MPPEPSCFPPISQPGHNSPFPSGLVCGLQTMARARAKCLAAHDAFDLVWSRKENILLFIIFILLLSAWFSFMLRVNCKRIVAEPSKNSWLISDTAPFASKSIMDESCSSKVGPHGDMFINKWILWWIKTHNRIQNTSGRKELGLKVLRFDPDASDGHHEPLQILSF